MAIKKYILSIGLIALAAIAFGQPRSFSRRPEIFIKEFNKYIATQSTKKDAAILYTFTTKWDSAKFVEPEQRNIINVANEMLQNDMKIPLFVLFTETMLYAKDSIDQAKYISWSKSLLPAVKSGNKTFITLLTASRNLFKDNTIYVSPTKKMVCKG